MTTSPLSTSATGPARVPESPLFTPPRFLISLHLGRPRPTGPSPERLLHCKLDLDLFQPTLSLKVRLRVGHASGIPSWFGPHPSLPLLSSLPFLSSPPLPLLPSTRGRPGDRSFASNSVVDTGVCQRLSPQTLAASTHQDRAPESTPTPLRQSALTEETSELTPTSSAKVLSKTRNKK